MHNIWHRTQVLWAPEACISGNDVGGFCKAIKGKNPKPWWPSLG